MMRTRPSGHVLGVRIRGRAGPRPARVPWWGPHALRRESLATLLALTVAGCGAPDLSDLERHVEQVGQSSTLDARAPVAQAEDSVKYEAMTERSPFEPFAEIQGARTPAVPDPARARRPPEFFPLGQLEMVGTLAGRGRILALIRDPRGTTHPLGVGDYLGRDHGRVTKVRESRIEVLELVEDGRGGWTGRPRALELNIPDASEGRAGNPGADHGIGGSEG